LGNRSGWGRGQDWEAPGGDGFQSRLAKYGTFAGGTAGLGRAGGACGGPGKLRIPAPRILKQRRRAGTGEKTRSDVPGWAHPKAWHRDHGPSELLGRKGRAWAKKKSISCTRVVTRARRGGQKKNRPNIFGGGGGGGAGRSSGRSGVCFLLGKRKKNRGNIAGFSRPTARTAFGPARGMGGFGGRWGQIRNPKGLSKGSWERLREGGVRPPHGGIVRWGLRKETRPSRPEAAWRTVSGWKTVD